MRCCIEIHPQHNHPETCAEALKFRPIKKGSETQEDLIDLFKQGVRPMEAYRIMQKRAGHDETLLGASILYIKKASSNIPGYRIEDIRVAHNH